MRAEQEKKHAPAGDLLGEHPLEECEQRKHRKREQQRSRELHSGKTAPAGQEGKDAAQNRQQRGYARMERITPLPGCQRIGHRSIPAGHIKRRNRGAGGKRQCQRQGGQKIKKRLPGPASEGFVPQQVHRFLFRIFFMAESVLLSI